MTIKVAYIQNRTIQYRFKNTGGSRDNTLQPVHCQACAEKRAPGSWIGEVRFCTNCREVNSNDLWLYCNRTVVRKTI